jgi:hypothetical protein
MAFALRECLSISYSSHPDPPDRTEPRSRGFSGTTISSCGTSTAEVIDGAALASKGGLSRLCHRLLLRADNVNTEVVT